MFKKIILFIMLSLIFITACQVNVEESEEKTTSKYYTPTSASTTYSSTGDYELYPVTTSGDVDLSYTLDLGSASSKSVYFIFTNTNVSTDTTAPTVTSNTISGNTQNNILYSTSANISGSDILPKQ